MTILYQIFNKFMKNSPLTPNVPCFRWRFRRSLRSRRNGGWLPPSATCRHPARVAKGRHSSNLRQGLLRPQSGVGEPQWLTCVLEARYSRLSLQKNINNLSIDFQQRKKKRLFALFTTKSAIFLVKNSNFTTRSLPKVVACFCIEICSIFVTHY